jgi:hypothetical protein
MSAQDKKNIPKHILRRIALRKFVAIPLTIFTATTGSIMAAHYATVELLDSEETYSLALFLGISLSTILAYGFKGLLKMRGQFKMDYVLVSLFAVTLMVSTASFLVHAIIAASAFL